MRPAVFILFPALMASVAAVTSRQAALQRVRNLLAAGIDNGTTVTTHCVDVHHVETTLVDHDGDGMVSPGDCLRFPASEPLDPAMGGQVSTARVPDGSGRIGQFTLNTTCGGATLTDIVDPSEAMSSFPGDLNSSVPNMTCPEGQLAVTATVTAPGSPPASRITTTTGRGVGVPVSSCDVYGSNYEEDAGLCYPRCKPGYSGAGPLCLTNCPSGFRDDGLYCAKPASYGRGGGGHFGLGSCPSGEERNGLLCYPKCRANFHAAGCCICSPDCPHGMTDIGVSCQKGSYGRGVGRPLKCPAGADYDAGLCYRQCPSGAHGVGPLCYAPCTSDQPYRLGIWCYHSESERNEILGAIIGGVLGGAVLIGGAVAITAPAIAAAVGTTVVAGPLAASVSLGGSLFTPVASLSILSIAA